VRREGLVGLDTDVSRTYVGSCTNISCLHGHLFYVSSSSFYLIPLLGFLLLLVSIIWGEAMCTAVHHFVH
jgi:hypothetical protein